MIRKIRTSELRTGMYIHDLDCGWMNHPFVSNRYAVKDSKLIQKIASAGIRNVCIDSARGKDVEQAAAMDEVNQALQQELQKAARDGDQPGVDLLRPTLRAIYIGIKRCYEKIRDIDLARLSLERIVTAIKPSDYGIDLSAFL